MTRCLCCAVGKDVAELIFEDLDNRNTFLLLSIAFAEQIFDVKTAENNRPR